ncbi:MAG: hypothetical protein A2277_21310 [Desulfobacterales bacterium RIFOXYA12_FULL_46_15]|nr:MAG: hypothetical protein A2277_21310 [Desulfobacterales bacterium RIFOXYA12_FULL_46_15]
MAKKIIFIHQPDFLPWMGFFYRWAVSDLFIMLDDVQFIRRGWHHRDKIKTPDGAKWLTVPVKKKGNYFQPINQVDILSLEDWQKDHLNLIHASYKNAPEFKSVFPKIEDIYLKQNFKLVDLNLNFLHFIAGYLNISTPFRFSSEFSLEKKGSERLIELVSLAGGTDYLTGIGSRTYLDEEKFSNQTIRVLWNEFSTPYYSQLHGDFIPDLSILDALMMLPQRKLQYLCTGDPVYAEMCA